MGKPSLLKVNVVTIFPEFFRDPLNTSIPNRAKDQGLAEYRVIDLRSYTSDARGTIDDVPYGGGSGMVMKPEPFFRAVDDLEPSGPVVLMSARGKKFTHEDAVRYSVGPELTLLCGHYKDVDQRVADHLATEEVSIGNFILSGGEIPSLAVIDAVVRLLPGAIGDHDSASTDSFYEEPTLLSPPSYTRPSEYRSYRVPEVLRSGDHTKIQEWRLSQTRDTQEK
jgi:tRNA (guanine37-N1)-methyltransferase